MADPQMLARAHHLILQRFVREGRAPHYVELGHELGLPPEDARQALLDLVALRLPGVWLAPGTDYIGSYAPFSNQPTQYLVSVDGQQRWYGQ